MTNRVRFERNMERLRGWHGKRGLGICNCKTVTMTTVTMVTGTMATGRGWHTKRGEDGMQNGETENARLERKTGRG